MKRIFESVYSPVSWTFMILVLLCIPGDAIPDLDGPTIPFFDKYVHFILFSGFGFLWNIYLICKKYSPEKLKKGYLLIFILGVLYGTIMELVQHYLIPDRSFDTGDILADAAGSAAAYALFYFKRLNINSGN